MPDIEYGKVVEMKVTDLRIDKQNYRIDWKDNTTDAEAILKLFEEEKIIEMAEDIFSSGGLNPQENFIVIRQNEKNIVLEGNRRLLAIRCLLNPALIPNDFKQEFQKIGPISPELIRAISTVNVVFMRSREEALPFIAAKHSGDSILQWGYISMWRHHYDVYVRANRDLDETVKQLKITRSKIIESIKFHNLINYARSLQFWDEQGLRNLINKNRLEMTRWTRALGYSDIVNSLGLSYGPAPEYNISHSSDMSKEKFDYLIFMFTKAALLDNGEDKITTRAESDDVIPLIQRWKSEYDRLHPAPSPLRHTSPSSPPNSLNGMSPTTTTTTRPRRFRGRAATRYFKALVCNINDQRLIKLTNEISTINVNNFPAASVMLARALIESSLEYQLKKKDKFMTYKNWCNGKCDLDKMIKFVINNKVSLFQDPSIADSLSFLQGRGGHRRYMNDVVHGNYVDPTAAGVEAIAGDTRELLKAILNDSA